MATTAFETSQKTSPQGICMGPFCPVLESQQPPMDERLAAEHSCKEIAGCAALQAILEGAQNA